MTADPGQHPVLEARSMVKRFPGVLALDRVDLQIDAGEVHGLIGENGAGKSTLMHILAGAQQPDEGKMLLDGQCVQFANPREAFDRGISIVYQELKRQGLAIVVVSSELPELLGIADRIMVMCEGRKTAEFDGNEANEEAIMRAAVPGVLEHA